MRALFKNYAEECYCNNYCTVEPFSTFEEFESEVNGPNDGVEVDFYEVIEIEGNATSGIHFKYRSSFLEYDSIYKEKNKLVLSTPSSPTQATEKQSVLVYQNFQVLTSTFIRKYFEVNDTTTFQIQAQKISTPNLSDLTLEMALFSLVFLSYYFFIVLWMVTEKEKKQDIFLYGQGVSKRKYQLSWFLTYLIIIIVPTLIVSIIIFLNFFREANLLCLFILSQLLCIINIFF